MNLRSRFHIQKAESRDGVLAHQHNRGATMAGTTSDFCSGSPPSLRSVEDDKRGTLMCFFDVEDDVRGGARLCFFDVEDDKRGTLMCFFDVEDDVRGGARLCFLMSRRT